MKTWFLAKVHWVSQIGSDPNDPEDLRLQKQLLAPAIFLVMIATALWGLTYIFFNELIPGLVSISYSVFSLISLAVIARTRRIQFILTAHILFGLLLPFSHHYVLGGFAGSSGVVMWCIMSPLAALFFFSAEASLPWWIAYMALLVVAGLIQPWMSHPNHLPGAVITAFFAMNIGAVSSIVILMLNSFKQQKNEAYRLLRIEQEKAEDLLVNMLPREIAAILKNEKRTIAEAYDGASILFADLVGFTPLTASMAPVELVNLLNQIFSYFDALAEKYQAEKIRTIGDNYMVAAGVPRRRSDHALALAAMALEMQGYVDCLPVIDGKRIAFRIGINSGPVIGGVIGQKKFVYDLWGDAVNIASRMESHGVAGKIQITQATYELIHDQFACEWRGKMEIKGRGEMSTWFLTAPLRPDAAHS